MRVKKLLRPAVLRQIQRLAPLATVVLLAGCASLSPAEAPTPSGAAAPTAAPSTVACHDWHAWHDSMPGKDPTLYVVGTCDLPTPGHAVTLRRKAPQGINPRDLLLEKVVTPPSGAAAQVITPVEARYEEKTDMKYDTVTVLSDGVTVRVDETS